MDAKTVGGWRWVLLRNSVTKGATWKRITLLPFPVSLCFLATIQEQLCLAVLSLTEDSWWSYLKAVMGQ